MILVTGSTGMVGGLVLQELAARGNHPLRAMYRGEKDLAAIPKGVEPVQADFKDPQSLDRALKGVEAAYLVCAAIPDLVELETNFLLACKGIGVPHVVIQSARGAGDYDKSFPSWHRKVEDKARELQIPATILRPNGFMQNIRSYYAATIKAQDCFYDALGKSKISLIDVRDIAAAAAISLSSRSTIGGIFELSGPEAIGNEDLALRISKIAGRPIHYVPLTLDQMRKGMIDSGMPESIAGAIVELYEYYQTGKGEDSDAVLRGLLGREPRTIDSYLAESASIFAK